MTEADEEAEIVEDEPDGASGSSIEAIEEAAAAIAEEGDDVTPAAKMQQIMGGIVGQFGPQPHPLAEKMTAQHITDMLEIQKTGMTKQFDDVKHARKYGMAALVVVVVFVLTLVGVLLYTDNAQSATQILGALTFIGSGILGGWGFARGRGSGQ